MTRRKEWCLISYLHGESSSAPASNGRGLQAGTGLESIGAADISDGRQKKGLQEMRVVDAIAAVGVGGEVTPATSPSDHWGRSSVQASMAFHMAPFAGVTVESSGSRSATNPLAIT